MTNGRAKGAAAENEVARMLAEWWVQLEPGCVFKRTPQSGGWSRPDARAEFRTSGDLVTTAKHFPFVVEVKRRERFSDQYLQGRASPVWEWWRQAQRQAAEQGPEAVPLLVFRRNREPWRALVSEAWWRDQGFALWRSSRTIPGRWAGAVRGTRPVVHYFDHVLSITPRQYVPELRRGLGSTVGGILKWR